MVYVNSNYKKIEKQNIEQQKSNLGPMAALVHKTLGPVFKFLEGLKNNPEGKEEYEMIAKLSLHEPYKEVEIESEINNPQANA